MTTCYMCDQQANTVEHAPPKCIFPEKKDVPPGKDYRKKLVTVPSCELHNTETSRDDEYLLYMLSASITSSDVGLNQLRKSGEAKKAAKATKAVNAAVTPVCETSLVWSTEALSPTLARFLEFASEARRP